MQIILLGTGTPIIDQTRQQSALVINLGDENLLFDSGIGVTSQLVKAGILPQTIDVVFITHHHQDHISGLGDFILTAWKNGRRKPITIFGPVGTESIVNLLLDQIFASDIAFTLFFDPGAIDVKEIIRVTDVTPGLIHNNGRFTVFTEYVEHGNGLGLSREIWPCLGYRLESNGKVIAISGDTVACDGLDQLARNADVLVQCCYLAEVEITTPEAENQSKYVIASSGQVGKIATRNNVKKMILTHFRPKSKEFMQKLKDDVHKDYTGEIIIGEDLMVMDI